MRPENTLSAFEYAIAVGVDAIEMDVVVTRDDVVVVSHEPRLNGGPCQPPAPGMDRAIRDLTLAEVARWDCGARANPRFPDQLLVPGARIPTLDQVFELAGRGTFLFNIEIKSFPERPELTPTPERFAELVFEAIMRHHVRHRVMVQSFDFRTLAAMRKLAPDIRLAALYAGRPKSFVAIARDAGGDIIAPYHALVTARRVRAAHAAGLPVIPWTANQPRQWKRLIAAGVDAIITDHPAALIEFLRNFQ